MRRWARVIALLAGLYYLVLGLWAFAAPESFAAGAATFPPYNVHLLHDAGSFSAGLGAALVAAAVWSDGLAAALFGGAVASVLHAVAHVMDRDLGGRVSDPYTLGVVALVAGVVVAGRRRARAG